MLVLTREVGEAFTIDDEIIVEVLGVNGGQVRLGIDAPRCIKVHRTEVFERIAAKQREEELHGTGA